MEQNSKPSSSLHVLIFPAPGQGHVNAMLRLAELLCLANLNITFLNYESIHEQLFRYTDVEVRFAKYPGFQFQTIKNCFPADGPVGNTAESLRMLFEAMQLKSKPIFKKIVIEINNAQPINCIIGDMVMGFVYDVANEVGIPGVQFHTISACSFLTFLSVPDLVAADELPVKVKEDQMDKLITKVPGMETFLRLKDLPDFCREISDPTLLLVYNQMRDSERLILNTFEELEAPVLSHIRTRYPKTYTIGPVHQHLKSKLKSSEKQEQYSASNSIWEVDRSCMKWLDEQPIQSVLYVSFGSTTIMTVEQFLEFWHGMVNSKKRFLWVIRHESITDKDGTFLKQIPAELEVGQKENGYIVRWAPQEEVLGHKAVGGFMTHSGWNSTLEGVVAGVPMICWPYFGDQPVNSRFVSEVWKVGLNLGDYWYSDRRIVENVVNDLMVNKREEIVRSSAKMVELARKCVEEGGSSSFYLDSLIEDIRMMSIEKSKELI